MGSIEIARVPQSFAELRDVAAGSATEARKCRESYEGVAGRFAGTLRFALQARLRPQNADRVAWEFEQQMDKVVGAALDLQGELNALSNLAESHRERVSRMPANERLEAESPFKM